MWKRGLNPCRNHLKKDGTNLGHGDIMTKPLWLTIAEEEKGVKEYVGDADNPRIVEYHQTTSLKATDDEVPWCSAFVNWCIKQAGYNGTDSAAARSWLEWGVELPEGRPGAITVFRRKGSPWSGHVGFYIDEDDDGVFVLGGNQNDSVNVACFSWNDLLDFRWPEE